MRLIDYIKRDPVVFDALTEAKTFDTTGLITSDTVTFVVDNIATQLIAAVDATDRPDVTAMTFTPLARDLLKVRPVDDPTGPSRMHLEELCVLPPFPDCFFEFRYPWAAPVECEYEGVHVRSHSPDGHSHIMEAGVYYLMRLGAATAIGVDSTAEIVTDPEGRITAFRRQARTTAEQAAAGATTIPNLKEFLIAIASMMLLSTKAATAVLSPEGRMSRQERRFAEQHPDRVVVPVRYYTLTVDLSKKAPATASGSGLGGWEQAWHRVRAHLRHLRSGKTVQVRAHSKGNPLKGILEKQYELKGSAHTEVGAKEPGEELSAPEGKSEAA